MSTTAAIWLVCLLGLIYASRLRTVYACSAYFMTFFAAPQFWWWGRGVLTSITLRWNLFAALAFASVVILLRWRDAAVFSKRCRLFFFVLALYVVNAVVVHYAAAAEPIASFRYLDVLWKAACLSWLIRLSIVTEQDIDIILFSIVVLSGYIGYEVVINHAGTIIHGRLEGIGIANASGSNGIGALMSLGLVYAGYFVVSNRSVVLRVVSFLLAPFILDTVLRCNSRGAFLGLIASGLWLIVAAKGKLKSRALLLFLLGGAAILVQAGDDKIWERFNSTFLDEAERDKSAGERILYWKAAIEMIKDYPLGSGGKAAFASNRGSAYIAHFRPGEFRSVHNGYLDLAAGWGLQGFLLFGFALTIAFSGMFVASRRRATAGNYDSAFLGAAMQAALLGQLICTMFTSILDGEWYLWMAATALAYAHFEREDSSSELTEEELDDDSEILDNVTDNKM